VIEGRTLHDAWVDVVEKIPNCSAPIFLLRATASTYRVSSSSAFVSASRGFFSRGPSSLSAVPTAANPAATAAAFAAFFAVALTFETVIEGEGFLAFDTLFELVLPLFEALAPARFDDDFAAVRLDAFFKLPPIIACFSN
jgi:hypothetical protein